MTDSDLKQIAKLIESGLLASEERFAKRLADLEQSINKKLSTLEQNVVN